MSTKTLSSITLKIDVRERDLIFAVRSTLQNAKDVPETHAARITLCETTLQIGDIELVDETGNVLVLFERKTVADLLASIKDGRYDEQSCRLRETSGLHPHNVVYLVEGSGNRQSTFYSALFSIFYYKGFSVLKTQNLQESAYFLCNCAVKVLREKDKGNAAKTAFYGKPCAQKAESGGDGGGGDGEECKDDNGNDTINRPSESYIEVIKKSKKENLTAQNIDAIMLAQIPGISAVTAQAIMARFGTLKQLMAEMEADANCLKDVCTQAENGLRRKISKSVIARLFEFLLKA